jgi:osmotically-inducible protein OsmY
MTRSSFNLMLVLTIALSPCLGGCAVAVVGGMAAAGGVGYEAAQERGINGAYDDIAIQTHIATDLSSQYGAITPTVYQGRVLLTGESPTPEAKAQAEQVASRVPGVRALYDEVAVAPPEDGWQTAKDSWISARVRGDLMLDPDVRSGNYTIATDRQSVYLIGSARTQAELNRATELARYVPGVERVVSYVEIRSGVAAAAPLSGPSQAVIPPATPNRGPGPATPPSYNAPIQVQKL